MNVTNELTEKENFRFHFRVSGKATRYW